MIIGASRSELLEWINSEFGANYTKIEQCGNGAVYCQIFDSVHPGKILMSKVNLQPKKEFQILSNYKLLQGGFNKVGITREVPVEKLMKFRLQDNLEFLQWFCKFYSNAETQGGGVRSSNVKSRIAVTPASGNRRRLSVTGNSTMRRRTFTPTEVAPVGSRRLRDEVNELQEKLDDSLQTQESLETERNFYFNKLREIEIICQNLNDKLNESAKLEVTVPELVKHMQEILYSTAEGFQVPEEEEVNTPGQENIENDLKILDEETF
ncbi:DEKNAAC101581 [Brettanomyces naardenensis]|uniref:DEKNAAC101581 n=1 Tax=Brettanomyces naardenensis TaxID=13370 RepID=A0A448YIP8_BRENA|nr:DEKNAAC101581 [Brettanomyces naardenensis]